MSLTVDATARRVAIQQAIGRTIDQLSTARCANGTSPRAHADWIDLLDTRIAEVAATVLAGSQPVLDDLVGLAADVEGLLEQLMREAAA